MFIWEGLIIYTIINFVIKLYLLPILLLIKIRADYVLKLLCDFARTEEWYFSYRIRPMKQTKHIQILQKACDIKKKIAIVLQGPIRDNSDFLIETIKFYRKQYPDVDIIVSTWDDEDLKVLEELDKEKIYIIQSSKPDYSGILNVNYQIVSTRAGVNKASELGNEYVIKTRTDQRVCKPYIFYSLCELLSLYEPQNTNFMQNRIIITSTFIHNMFTPYFFSDFFYMGTVKDIGNLFACDLDYRQDRYEKKMSRKKYSETMYPPEIYLLKTYLINCLNYNCNDTIKDYWQCLKDFFICLDRKDIDLFTPKYEYNYAEHIANSEFAFNDDKHNKVLMGFNFWTWLNLYTGIFQYKTEYEKEMDVEF